MKQPKQLVRNPDGTKTIVRPYREPRVPAPTKQPTEHELREQAVREYLVRKGAGPYENGTLTDADRDALVDQHGDAMREHLIRHVWSPTWPARE